MSDDYKEIFFGANRENYLLLQWPTDSDSRYNLTTVVEVKTRGFSAKTDWFISELELKDFAAQLNQAYKKLSGEAVLRAATQNWLEVHVIFERLGKVIITGLLREPSSSGAGNQLKFEIMGLDQTYIPAILEQLNALSL